MRFSFQPDPGLSLRPTAVIRFSRALIRLSIVNRGPAGPEERHAVAAGPDLIPASMDRAASAARGRSGRPPAASKREARRKAGQGKKFVPPPLSLSPRWDLIPHRPAHAFSSRWECRDSGSVITRSVAWVGGRLVPPRPLSGCSAEHLALYHHLDEATAGHGRPRYRASRAIGASAPPLAPLGT